MEKIRLDLALVERGLTESREKAKALIMAGQVFVDGRKIDKAGTGILAKQRIEIKGKTLPFVSRGGLKLAKALEVFPINLKGKIVADIGASTGGFTDCALQNGAKKVYAIDVGYGQLEWKLRQDPRVISLEKTNARYLTEEALGEKVNFITIDVSFISLKKILPAVKNISKENAEIVALIKPQFEAGKEKVGKKGVVKDPLVHIEVIKNVINECKEQNLGIKGLTFSPVKGPEGNIEYLIWLDKTGIFEEFDVEKIVKNATEDLKKG